CPKRLSPQPYAEPPAVTPQVRQTPALSIVKRSPPATGAGLGWYQGDDAVPSPSWPNTLSPQQYAAWLVLTPQLCTYPPFTEAKVTRTTNTALVTSVRRAAVAASVYPRPGRSRGEDALTCLRDDREQHN